jgi:hypothetical protein
MLKPAHVVAHPEPAHIVSPRPLAAAHPLKAAISKPTIVKGKMLDEAPPPADGQPAADSSDGAAPAEPTEIFHSPVGDLKPTGIMSVFFNENIMITAVCIIGFLLLAICCFAHNADCALT